MGWMECRKGEKVRVKREDREKPTVTFTSG